jgi:predicted nucleic acid-binding protein
VLQRFLLDTTVLIDISKGAPEVYGRLGTLLEGGEAGVCAVSVAEFMTGVPPTKRAWMARVIDQFTYWHLTREAAETAGMLRYDLARRGIALQVPDALIAGLAQALKAVLVTDNAKDFVHTGVPIVRLRD